MKNAVQIAMLMPHAPVLVQHLAGGTRMRRERVEMETPAIKKTGRSLGDSGRALTSGSSLCVVSRRIAPIPPSLIPTS